MTIAIPAETREKQINAIDGILFIRWIEDYKSSHSKAIVSCEKYGHQWVSTPNRLIHHGSGCNQCKGINLRYSQRFPADARVAQINENPLIQFIRWDGEYVNQYSKAVVECVAGKHEFSATVTHLVHRRSGCAKCSGRYVRTQLETESLINEIPKVKFIKWESTYKTNKSRANVFCIECGNHWIATPASLLSNGSGCPSCAKTGFNPSISSSMYVLRSYCGASMKIGISNNHKRRIVKLSKSTPFEFELVDLIVGDGSLISNLECAIHSITDECEFSSKFDGFTEWRKWNPLIHVWIDFIKNNYNHVKCMSKHELSSILISVK